MGLRTRLLTAIGFGPKQQAEPAKRRRRTYAGAIINRLTSDWISNGTSADAEIKTSLRKLRDRSRQMVRDNPYARQAKRTTQINVIGAGVKMQSQVMSLRGNRRDEKINGLIEAKWERWCRKDYCDVAGKQSFNMFEWLAAGALPESGEVIFRIHRRPFGGSKVPIALEIIESDLLDDEYNGAVSAKGNEWRMGVEIDRYGRPVQYAFLTRHPGDYWFAGSPDRENVKHVFLPAKDVIHLFIPERPNQHRGVPWFAPVITDAHQLAGYEEAAVVRARSAASLMGFVTSPEGELEADDVENEQRITEFEPGVFKYLDPGQSVTVPDISSPDAQYEAFVRAKTRRFASGFGCSYETLSRDFSETNYSSSRLSLLEDRDHWRVMQAYLIENFHMRVFREWLDVAVLTGELALPDYELRPERYDSPKWLARGWSWVDPLKEVKAYREMEAAGYMTKAQICAQLGGDFDENIQQLAREKKSITDAGVQLDVDMAPPAAPIPPGEPAADGGEADSPEQPPRRAVKSRRKKASKVEEVQPERPEGSLN
jgi:lambda family phage portal protein